MEGFVRVYITGGGKFQEPNFRGHRERNESTLSNATSFYSSRGGHCCPAEGCYTIVTFLNIRVRLFKA
jgi:hypothetical protein